MIATRNRRLRPAVVVLLCLTALISTHFATAASPAEDLTRIWRKAARTGSYAFSMDIRQRTAPLPTVANVGRETTEQQLHLEGTDNLLDATLDLQAWTQGGSVLEPASAIEIRVDEDGTWARAAGQPWEPVDGFSELFAPTGDVLAFTAAARDVRQLETVQKRGSTYRRYTYEINGPRYAAYIRDQLQSQLTAKGELPPGATLDLPSEYKGMTGTGELWVGSGELPVRQIINLTFPEQDAHRTSAEIVVDFTSFGSAAKTNHPLRAWLNDHTPDGRTTGTALQTIFAAATVVGVGILLIRSRSRSTYTIVALLVIASTLLTPVLRSSQVAAFSQRQTALNEAAEARRTESNMTQTLEALLTDTTPEPLSGPAALDLLESDDGTDSDGDGRSDIQEAFLGTRMFQFDSDLTAARSPDDTTDTDGDGLSDYVEELLGTDSDVVDTDSDLITDTLEVEGFTFSDGQGGVRTWYTDPESADTNSDGLTDGEEWDSNGDGAIDDTDGDTVPDLFDEDNDNDGVPDSVDISPYTHGNEIYSEAAPLSLVLDDLTPDKLTYVEFQARPVITDHLWYAYNVLDWPHDQQGQIQDGDDKTFYDVDSTTDPNPDNNGDLKMVPMLEIRIDGRKTNLPPQNVLSNYGIYTITVTEDASQIAAYVPLEIVNTDQGESRAAFYGKMLYLPGTDWGNAQQVRMVWVIQGLMDSCQEFTDGSCSSYSAYNEVQPIFTYDDEWTLTGLSIREDHGIDMAFVYEDPAEDADLNADLQLFQLAYGLEGTFLTGRTGADGQRDLTISEISRRFNHATNLGVSLEERWQIDNTLSVITRTFQHRDEGFMTAAMTETTDILNNHFTSYAAVNPITPTIMVAREERFRSTNLDTLVAEEPNMTWEGSLLRVNLTTESSPVHTLAGMTWAPYQYNEASSSWLANPIEHYWDELEQRYSSDLADATENVRLGSVLVLQMLYVSLYRGVTSMVQIADVALEQDSIREDKPLAASIAGTAGKVIKFVVNAWIMKGVDAAFYASQIGQYAKTLTFHRIGVATPASSLKAVARQVGRYLRGLWNGTARGIATLGCIVLVTLAVLTVVVIGLMELGKAYLAENQRARIAVATVVGVAMFAFTVVAPVMRVANVVSAVRAITGASQLSALKTVLLARGEISGAAKAAGIVGLVISVAVTWGVFIYAAISNDLPPGSVAFNELLAQTIAATIVAIVLFALSTTVVGAIIVAIIAVVDLILVLLGLDEYTITGFVTEYLGKALYHFELLVDTDVDMGPFSMSLARPLEGLVNGAQMQVRTTLTTTATHKDPEDLRVMAYSPIYYTQSQLRRTSFVYSLTEITTTLSTEINAMRDAWQLAYDHDWGLLSMYRGTATSDAETTITLAAGMNSVTDLVLNTGYALPGVECWSIPLPPFWYPIPICVPKSVEDNTSSLISSAVVLDVLPASLDEFVGLAWAHNSSFLQQRDHDGDGLINPFFNGNDPNDEAWDSDSDGLSDRFELEMRQLGTANGGAAFGPLDPDTDNDGLTDRQELAGGTDPSRRDTDGDLLTDAEEVYHQDIEDLDNDGDTQEWIGGWTLPLRITDTLGVPRTLTVLVRSDPLVVDADGDGLGDATEKTLATLAPNLYPFLPTVYNETPVKFYATTNDSDSIVGPGQTFVYSATVDNQLELDLYVLGTITTTVPGTLATTDPITGAFNLFRGDLDTLASTITVPASSSDVTVSLGSEMFAYQHDGDVRTKWRWSPAAAFTTGPTEGWPWYSAIAPAVDAANQGNAYAIASVEGNYTHDALTPNRIGQTAGSGAYLRYGTATIGGANLGSWLSRPPGPGPVRTPPEVICAENTGRCLTVWADDSYDACTTVDYQSLYCHSEQDGPGSHSEFYIDVDGSQIWGVSSTTTGDTENINVSRAFCNTETYRLWEEDDWPNDDDDYGAATVSAVAPGAGSHRHTDADATVSWYVHPNYNATIYGRIFDASGTAVCGANEPLALSNDLNATMLSPAVATDGTDFILVWGQDGVLQTSRFANTCTVETPRPLTGGERFSRNPRIVWAGDQYLVTWETTSSTGDGWDVRLSSLNRAGVYNGWWQTIAASSTQAPKPVIAHNTGTGQSMLVYILNGTQVMGRLIGAGAPATTFVIGSGAVRSVDVGYEPTHGGWMVTWVTTDAGGAETVHYKPLAADGAGMLSESDADLTGAVPAPYDALSSSGVACRLEVPDPSSGECGIIANPATPDAAGDPKSIALAKIGLLKVLPWNGTYSLDTEIPIVIDATGPSASFTSLQNGQYLTGTQTLVIGGDAEDNTHVALVWVSVDGGPWRLADGSASWAYAWDLQGLPDGAHTLSVYATDVAENDGPVQTITVNIDSQPPTATFGSAPGSVLAAEQDGNGQWHVALNGSITDPVAGTQPGSGAGSVEVKVTPNGTGWQTAQLTANTWLLDYPMSSFDEQGNPIVNPSGTYTLSLRAVDILSNATPDGTATQVRFYIDTTPPEAGLTYPSQNEQVISDGTLAFTGVITDPIPPDVVANVAGLEIAVVPSGTSPDAAWVPADVTTPGTSTSSWSAPIGTDLEGIYEISLRGSDTLGNRQDSRSDWFKWQGEIDTQSPRAQMMLTYRGAGHAAQTLFTGTAEDFNLVLDGLISPCTVQARDRTYYTSDWWDTTTGVGTRLTKITPSCIVRGHITDAVDFQVFDRYGHATTASATAPTVIQRTAVYTEPILASAVITPAHESVLPSLDPVDLTIGAYALNGLKALTVTVNGTQWATMAWPLSPVITNTLWVTPLTPTVEGNYLLETRVEDQAGNIQTELQPVTVTVDTQSPAITIDTRTLTTTHKLSLGRARLSGTVTDTVELETVGIATNTVSFDEARFGSGNWDYALNLGYDPDGELLTIYARAEDGVRSETVSEDVMIDLTPPAPVTVTLTRNTTSGPQPLSAGETIREIAPNLTVAWTPSSDGAGPVDYYVGWTSDPEPDLSLLTRYTSSGSHTQVVNEPQAVYAHVVLVDVHGNRQTASMGPIYVDAPRTPDYITDLNYYGWLDEACTLVGTDYEILRHITDDAAQPYAQRLYSSWDSTSMRFTWTGANWDRDGNLFIYLDTIAGGTATVYDPFSTGPAIGLPAGFLADTVVWVADGSAAQLLTWTGSSWQPQPWPADADFQQNTSLLPTHTDIRLPRAALLDSTTTAIKLVALATEDDALRIWATIPDKNPLNSSLVVNPVAVDLLEAPFTLQHNLSWPNLGNGICPTEDNGINAALYADLAANPSGVEIGYLEHDLSAMLDLGTPLDTDLNGIPDQRLPVDQAATLLGHEQTITYTLRYHNEGQGIAPDVNVALTAYGALDLNGGNTQTLSLGDIAPGASAEVIVRGSIVAPGTEKSAELDAVISDGIHGEYDRLWVLHRVDTSAPEALTISNPDPYAMAAPIYVEGSVEDPSGVPSLEIEVRDATNQTNTMLCTDATPDDGAWACPWDLTGATDGATFYLRARATDRWGNQSGWTPEHLVTVDTQLPTVRLSLDSLAALSDDLLTSAGIVLDGGVDDDRQAVAIDICASAVGAPVDEIACGRYAADPGTTAAGLWRAPAPVLDSGDGAWQTLWFYGYDKAGNRSLPLTRTTRIDVVPPVVTVITRETGTVLWLPTELLAGRVTDGYAVDQLEIRMTRPDGNAETYQLPITNGNWFFSQQFDTIGNYALSIDAWDIAGNQQHLGPFKFTVLAGDFVADTSVGDALLSDPAITGETFTYTTTVTNFGPSTAANTRLELIGPDTTPISSISGATCSVTANVVNCDLGDVPQGATRDVVLHLDVPLTLTEKLHFTAEVVSDKIDFRMVNNALERYVATYQPVSGLEIADSLPTPLDDSTVITATTFTGTDVVYTVDFGDGAGGSGVPITHTYADVGRYNAIVTASNAVNAITGTIWIPVDIPVSRPAVQQGFEEHGTFPPVGWLFQRTQSASDDIAWEDTVLRAHSGSASAYHNDLFGWYSSWLVTPQVTPTLGSELVFWQLVRYVDRYEGHSIWVSTSRGDPKYGDFVKLLDVAPGSEDQWAEVRVSLEAYLGQPLYIAFRYEGDFASEWYVDDVAVTTPLIALNDSPTIIGTTTQLTAAIGSGTNVSVTWDFGDGTSGEGLMPAHRYALPGTYTATVTARNTVSARSAETVIVVEGRTYSQHLPLVVNNYVPPCLDAYEPDDSQSLARSIATDGAAQEHSFHIPGDEDWVSFSVDDPAAVYVIETFDLQNTDTVIYLFDTDGETLLDWNDDAGPTDRSSRLTFRPYQTGVFTLRIVDYYPTAGGCDHLYHVRVTR